LDITETLIVLGVAILIGLVDEKTKPKEYYYEDRIVTVYKKYQCPIYCEANHHHYVYYTSDTNGMIIDRSKLGKKFKTK
jgi:hypothetical protein